MEIETRTTIAGMRKCHPEKPTLSPAVYNAVSEETFRGE